MAEAAESYDRGVAAGEIAQRLKGHDEHFARINGSLERVGDELHALNLAVQGLGDAAAARDAKVIAAKAALSEANEARRDQSERSWSPLTRVGAVVAILVGLALVYLAYRAGTLTEGSQR